MNSAMERKLKDLNRIICMDGTRRTTKMPEILHSLHLISIDINVFDQIFYEIFVFHARLGYSISLF